MSEKIQTYINQVKDGAAQRALQAIFQAVDTELDALRTLANECKVDVNALVTDATAIRTAVTSITAKLDLDAGVTDTNYASTCNPAAITATTIAAAAAVESLTS